MVRKFFASRKSTSYYTFVRRLNKQQTTQNSQFGVFGHLKIMTTFIFDHSKRYLRPDTGQYQLKNQKTFLIRKKRNIFRVIDVYS